MAAFLILAVCGCDPSRSFVAQFVSYDKKPVQIFSDVGTPFLLYDQDLIRVEFDPQTSQTNPYMMIRSQRGLQILSVPRHSFQAVDAFKLSKESSRQEMNIYVFPIERQTSAKKIREKRPCKSGGKKSVLVEYSDWQVGMRIEFEGRGYAVSYDDRPFSKSRVLQDLTGCRK